MKCNCSAESLPQIDLSCKETYIKYKEYIDVLFNYKEHLRSWVFEYEFLSTQRKLDNEKNINWN